MKSLLSMRYFLTIYLILNYLESVILSEIPNIIIPNFDVREKFSNCYNDGYSQNIDPVVCYTNWPIQFSLIVTDKNCIKKIGNNRLISSMNINSCMTLFNSITCRNFKDFFISTELTLKTINETIKFFNLNGSQYLDEYPYKILQDSETSPGHFPPCSNYSSSIENITINENYDILDETLEDDYKLIKKIIFEEGPILAFLLTDVKVLMDKTTSIYYPENITEKNNDGVKFIRIIGWRTLDKKLYWIFSYTLEQNWGIANEKLIPQKDYSLKFINLQLN